MKTNWAKVSQVYHANERTTLGKGSQHMIRMMMKYVTFEYRFTTRCVCVCVYIYIQVNGTMHMYIVTDGI
jgi:hypothetical protein